MVLWCFVSWFVGDLLFPYQDRPSHRLLLFLGQPKLLFQMQFGDIIAGVSLLIDFFSRRLFAFGRAVLWRLLQKQRRVLYRSLWCKLNELTSMQFRTGTPLFSRGFFVLNKFHSSGPHYPDFVYNHLQNTSDSSKTRSFVVFPLKHRNRKNKNAWFSTNAIRNLLETKRRPHESDATDRSIGSLVATWSLFGPALLGLRSVAWPLEEKQLAVLALFFVICGGWLV